MRISSISMALLALALGGSLSASQLQTFEIYSTASPFSSTGGTLNDGGSYSGTFTLDVSQIPSLSNGGSFSLSSWDITLTAGTLFGAQQYSSSLPGQSATFEIHEESVASLPVDLDVIYFFAPNDTSIFSLVFVEPNGTFSGGIIQEAKQSKSKKARTDTSGSAMALDPAQMAPEPGTQSTLLGGMAVGFALLVRARRAAGTKTASNGR